MAHKVKIYGAGSIGNHLAFACRNKGWDVLMVDPDPGALERTRTDIYPSRYGRWDEGIRLATPDRLPRERYDLVIIGTPPEAHNALALEVLAQDAPRALLIEKPLCTPSLERAQELWEASRRGKCWVAVGYNHAFTRNTLRAEQLLASGRIGEPVTIGVDWLEHWGGIFKAHPWLAGPQDSYLGYTGRGGGAACEHSHGIHLWQHFSRRLGAGRIREVSAVWDVVDDGAMNYDRICQIQVVTEQGLVGRIVQDVVTEPAEKKLFVQGTTGRLEWFASRDPAHDAVYCWDRAGGWQREEIARTRPDDFKGEIEHVGAVLDGASAADSPIGLERGLDTMLVIAAAQLSARIRSAVRIDYGAGYVPDSLHPVS
jgi:predicted dehydrogenase